MIIYLAAPSYEAGRAFALERGWPQVAYNRFAMPVEGDRPNDIRLVTRFNELLPVPGGIKIIYTPEFDDESYSVLINDGGAQRIYI